MKTDFCGRQDTKTSIPLFPTGPLSIEVEYKAKSSYPVVPSSSPEGTVGVHIAAPIYSPRQHRTWEVMLKKHFKLACRHLCPQYLQGLELLKFPKRSVPLLANSSTILQQSSQWQIVRVEGLVAPQIFFSLLANKLFPCTDFIRHFDEIDYTPAPDTFHDQIGHLPMLTHQRFAEFFHLFGLAGSRAETHDELQWFNRIYWFTVEFGLINPTVHRVHPNPAQTCIYGAGLASSCGEILHSLSPGVHRRPFQIEAVIQTDFDIHQMQETLFEIESFDELEFQFKSWASVKGFL